MKKAEKRLRDMNLEKDFLHANESECKYLKELY